MHYILNLEFNFQKESSTLIFKSNHLSTAQITKTNIELETKLHKQTFTEITHFCVIEGNLIDKTAINLKVFDEFMEWGSRERPFDPTLIENLQYLLFEYNKQLIYLCLCPGTEEEPYCLIKILPKTTPSTGVSGMMEYTNFGYLFNIFMDFV